MKLRSLFPSRGPGYELFDTCSLIFTIGFLGYVITGPSAVQQAALPPLRLISEQSLGWGLTGAAAIGIICAYGGPKAHRVGYVIAVTAAGAMCLNYLVGGLQTWELRPFLSVVFYGWVTRRLIRDMREIQP